MRLWDLTTNTVTMTLTQRSGAVAITPDGKTIATGAGDGTIWLLPSPPAWRDELCQRAGRNLTFDEWQTSFTDRTFEQRMCPSYPGDEG